ncbi:MAG: hypothetical protein ACAF41_32775 [Leptolyngbya sp. BL-A-14]
MEVPLRLPTNDGDRNPHAAFKPESRGKPLPPVGSTNTLNYRNPALITEPLWSYDYSSDRRR